MYIEHFGLARPLLDDGIACDDRIYVGPAQRAAQADLELALNRGDAVVVIEGPAGTGKSTLAASALRDAATQLAIGCLTDPAETAHELLEQLLTEFGFSPYRLSRTERHTHWRQYLSEMAATGSRVGIVVEATDRLDPRVLAELERLTSADIRGSAGATVLLTASRPLTALLDDDRLASLKQRCRAVIRIAPLTAEETLHYLEFRFQAAGGSWDAVGTPEVAARLHEVSGGIFRVIDNVLESCLARAARDGESRISVDLLERVAAQLPGSAAGTATPAAIGSAGSAATVEPNRTDTNVQSEARIEPDDSKPAVDVAAEPNDSYVALDVAAAPDDGDFPADVAGSLDDSDVAPEVAAALDDGDLSVDAVAAPVADVMAPALGPVPAHSRVATPEADAPRQAAPPAPAPEPEPTRVAPREAPAVEPSAAAAGPHAAEPGTADPAAPVRSESPADRPAVAAPALDLDDLGLEISLSGLTELTLEPVDAARSANVAPAAADRPPAAAPPEPVGADLPVPPELGITDALDPAAVDPVDRYANVEPADEPDLPDLPELNLEDAVDVPAESAFDIPVLDDVVPVATLTGADDPIDEDVVEALLSLSGAGTPSHATPGNVAAPEIDTDAVSIDAGVEAEVDAEVDSDADSVELVEMDLDDADGLSDEDRRQIEMLEAFANADALEQISESMAETIFGDAYAESISADIKATYDGLSKAREEGLADEEIEDASSATGAFANR